MKPDWKDAPEWARWLSCDPAGHWKWHYNRPSLIWVDDYDGLDTWAGESEPPKPAEMLEERPDEQG